MENAFHHYLLIIRATLASKEPKMTLNFIGAINALVQ